MIRMVSKALVSMAYKSGQEVADSAFVFPFLCHSLLKALCSSRGGLALEGGGEVCL
jgi:hypothetical protein